MWFAVFDLAPAYLSGIVSHWFLFSSHQPSWTIYCPSRPDFSVSQPWQYWHLGWIILLLGMGAALIERRKMHWKMFSNIPGLYPLDDSDISKLWQSKMSPDISRCPRKGKITPVENHCSRALYSLMFLCNTCSCLCLALISLVHLLNS